MIHRAREQLAQAVDLLCFLLLLLLVVWLPIPFGSRSMWSIHLLQVVVSAVLLLWALGNLLMPSASPRRWSSIKYIIFLMLTWLLYQLFQVIPLPPDALKFLSPVAHEMYESASSRQGISYSISLDRNSTVHEAVLYGAYVALFVLVYALVNSRQRLLLLASTLFLVGFAQSVFGIFSTLTNAPLMDVEVLEGHRWVSGTFLNRNHFAGHILLTVGMGLSLLLCSGSPTRRWLGVRNVVFNLSDLLLRPTGWIFLCLVVLLSALMLSESRGGVLSLIVSLCAVCFLVLLRDQKKYRATRVAVTVGAAMFIAALWLGSGTLIQRFHDIGNDERVEQWRLTAKIVADYPAVGVGGGNYRWTFPNYRGGTLRLRTYDHAHSDYLETLVEQGVAGTLLLGLAIGVIFIKLIHVYTSGYSAFVKNAVTGVLVAMTGLLVHGLVDFNFRIPANAGYYYIIAALGLAATTLDHRKIHTHEIER